MKKLLILAVSLILLASLVFAADIFGTTPKDEPGNGGAPIKSISTDGDDIGDPQKARIDLKPEEGEEIGDPMYFIGGGADGTLLSYPGGIYFEGEGGSPVKYPVGGAKTAIYFGEDGNAKIKSTTTLGLRLDF